MLRFASCPLLLLLAVILTGCGETKTSTPQGVAVVNMETVAMMTGLDLEMNKAIQSRNKQLGEDLARLQTQVDSDWQAKQKAIGDKPTDEQKKELEQIYQELNLKVRQAQTQARQNLGSFQQELANKFRERLSPISLEIAKEQGHSIVIVESPSILAFETSINITDLVVERIKQSQSEMPAGAPTAQGQPGTALTPGAGAQPTAPLNPPQSTTLKLPDLDKETEKKETPEKAETESKKEKPTKAEDKPESKPVAKPAPKAEAKAKSEAKPEPKPAPKEQPKAEKPADSPEKK